MDLFLPGGEGGREREKEKEREMRERASLNMQTNSL